MKKKLYTLCLQVDITFEGPNPWKQRAEIVSRIQSLLSAEFVEKVEVYCAEMQRSQLMKQNNLARSDPNENISSLFMV